MVIIILFKCSRGGSLCAAEPPIPCRRPVRAGNTPVAPNLNRRSPSRSTDVYRHGSGGERPEQRRLTVSGGPQRGWESDDITRRLPSSMLNTDGVAGGCGGGSHARSYFLCFLYGLVFFFFLSSSHILVPPSLSVSHSCGVKSFAVFIMFTPPRGSSLIFITIYR